MPLSTYALSRHVCTHYSIFSTTWYYSLTFHWFLHHHSSMIPWLHDSVFSIPFISCYVHFSFLRCCTTLKCNIWGELLYIQWYSILHCIDYVHVAIYLQIPLCSFCVLLTCEANHNNHFKWSNGHSIPDLHSQLFTSITTNDHFQYKWLILSSSH